MGTWGTGPFENDDASDWIFDLEDAADFGFIRVSLEPVLEEYIEAPDGALIIAAAEVVAAAAGPARASLPEEVEAWVDAHRDSFEPGDVALAIEAVTRVLGDGSELRELWTDADDDAWIADVNGLLDRLAARRPA